MTPRPALMTRVADRVRQDLETPLRRLLDVTSTGDDGSSLPPEVAAAAATIADYLQTLEHSLGDLAEGGAPAPRLTLALASELSFLARHLDGPLGVPTVERLQPRVRRAARLATLWLTPYSAPDTVTTGPDSDSVADWQQGAGVQEAAPPQPARGSEASAADVVEELPTDARPAPSADADEAASIVESRIDGLRERIRRLESRAELQERYWRYATHELRNAAHSLTLVVERLTTSEEGRAPWLEPLMRAAQTVVSRSQDVLDDQRAIEGHFEVRPERVDLVELALGALDEARDLARKADVRLVSERLPVGQAVWAHADPERVRQILHNLMRNALRATPSGGVVILEASDVDGAAAVSISDTGPGLAPEEAERMLAGEAGRSRDGTGLGLPLSRSLAEAMGGRVELLPARPGLGARFQLTLPRA